MSNRRGAANVSNIFAALLSFFLGTIMIYSMNDIIMYFINLNTNTPIKLIMTMSYLCLTILMVFYFPIHQLTSEDSQNQVQRF